MIDIEIKTKEKTIRQQITEWKELEELLLKYKDYMRISASINERNNNEKRNTR